MAAEIKPDNTLAAPQFTEGSGGLKRFDFAVANPPFSDKAWTNGLDPANDEFRDTSTRVSRRICMTWVRV